MEKEGKSQVRALSKHFNIVKGAKKRFQRCSTKGKKGRAGARRGGAQGKYGLERGRGLKGE